MATSIDFSSFNFSTEEVRQINELVMEEILQAPDLNILHTIYPGITSDKYVGFLGEGGLVGVANQGCDPTPQSWNIPSRQVKWEPKGWEVYLNECYKDIEQTMAIYAMNKGVEKADLTTTDYMAVVAEVLAVAIKKMIWRLVWFSDIYASSYKDKGVLAAGVDPKFFNLMDGLWKQLLMAAPIGSPMRIQIDANSQGEADQQMDSLTGQAAYEVLNKMYFKAPVTLRSQPDVVLACTQSFADAYMTYLEGKGLESSYHNLVEGINALSFRGLNIVPLPIWDEMILMYENDGKRLNNPHRAVLTTKRTLGVGTASHDVLTDLDIWYEKKDRQSYIYAADAMDVKLLSDKLFMLAI